MADSSQTLGYFANQDKGLSPQLKNTSEAIAKEVNRQTFPYPDDQVRLTNYTFYERLFWGNHFDAFNVKMESKEYGKVYARLKFIVANFPGLISKVVADMLFIEPPKIKMPEGGDQEFVDALVRANKLRMQWYESALDNSYFGDTGFKLRIGPRRPNEESTVIIENQTPKVYFPLYDPFNMKGEPKEHELAWAVRIGDKEYLRKEIHTHEVIRNELWLLEAGQIKEQVSLALFDNSLSDAEYIKGGQPLVIHIPNWRAGNRWNGVSDYFDLETLFYAIDNRMTKIDNVLDHHSDPILAVPDGILDEEGKVKRDQLHMFARPEGADQSNDPAYITWEANLEAAFTEIEKLVEMTFMMSETSPDILGMGQGQAESGRALKLKLLRTLAKAQRKQIYYTQGLIDMLYRAQILAYEYGVAVGEEKLKLKGEPKMPEIEWRDGLPADMRELLETEQIALDAGLTSKEDAMMRAYDMDEKTAQEKAKKIGEETALDLETRSVAENAGRMQELKAKPPVAN